MDEQYLDEIYVLFITKYNCSVLKLFSIFIHIIKHNIQHPTLSIVSYIVQYVSYQYLSVIVKVTTKQCAYGM